MSVTPESQFEPFLLVLDSALDGPFLIGSDRFYCWVRLQLSLSTNSLTLLARRDRSESEWDCGTQHLWPEMCPETCPETCPKTCPETCPEMCGTVGVYADLMVASTPILGPTTMPTAKSIGPSPRLTCGMVHVMEIASACMQDPEFLSCHSSHQLQLLPQPMHEQSWFPKTFTNKLGRVKKKEECTTSCKVASC